MHENWQPEYSMTLLGSAQVIARAALVLLTMVCLIGWALLGLRRMRGAPLLAARPATEVPWGLMDVLTLFAFWFSALVATSFVAQTLGLLPAPANPHLGAASSDPETQIRLADPAPAPSQPTAASSTAIFGLSIFFTALGVTAGIAYLGARFGRRFWRILLNYRWPDDLWLGLAGFALVTPPVLWLMNLLVQLIQYNHTTLQTIARSPTWSVILVTWISAGLIAPIAEEFLFRLVLQSWLQRLRLRDNPVHRGLCIYGDPPDVESAQSPPPLKPAATVVGQQPVHWGAIFVSALCFGIVHLEQGPAPIPLFIFALSLGYIFQRTGSLLPCILMHMMLNLFSLTIQTSFALESQRAIASAWSG